MGQLVGRKDRGEVSLHFNLKKKIEKKKLRAVSMQKPSRSYQVDIGEASRGTHLMYRRKEEPHDAATT